jgi:hypothetical protein
MRHINILHSDLGIAVPSFKTHAAIEPIKH